VVISKAIKSNVGAISRDKYVPDYFVSSDQYIVKEPGRLPTVFGREAEHNMFHGGTVFWDACSKYIFVKNQVSLGDGETISSKNEFET
jgi:hypothetical protein